MSLALRVLMRIAPLLLALAGCATGTATRAPEVLDRRTGATLTIAPAGWLFARDRSELAVGAHDYRVAQPVSVSVGGRRRWYLAVFEWSTLDARLAPRAPADVPLRLILDDRIVVLGPGVDPQDAGIARWPLAMPGRGARLRCYAIEEDVLRHWLAAREVRLRVGEEGQDPDGRYASRREARGALAALLGGATP